MTRTISSQQHTLAGGNSAENNLLGEFPLWRSAGLRPQSVEKKGARHTQEPVC